MVETDEDIRKKQKQAKEKKEELKKAPSKEKKKTVGDIQSNFLTQGTGSQASINAGQVEMLRQYLENNINLFAKETKKQ